MDVIVKRPSELTNAERDAWRAFQAADPNLHSPYFSVEFADACDQVRTDTQVAVLRVDGMLKGFFPFQRGPLGYSLPLGGPLSDFHGVITEVGYALDLKAVMRTAGISVYPFSFVPSAQACFSPNFNAQEMCHTANLEKGFEHWYEGRMSVYKKSLKKHEGNARRMAKHHGELSFTMDDRDGDAFDTLLAWKSAQYAATGIFDVFSVPWTSALLRALWETRSAHFAGQLSTLRAGGTLVAAHFGMHGSSAAHYWFPAYDPEFSTYGAGHALLLRMMQGHAEAGIDKVHLGVGDYRYKLQFGGETTPVSSGAALSPSLAAFIRQSAVTVQRGFEALPMGPVSRLPGRALRRLDRTMAFRLA